MTPRETLDLCRSLAIETSAIARLVEMAEQRIPLMPSGCRGITFGNVRGGNDAESAAIAHADGMEQWYYQRHAELVMRVEEVEDIIAMLTDDDKKVIRYYYIDAKTDLEIAPLIGAKDFRRAQEKRARIVKELEEMT